MSGKEEKKAKKAKKKAKKARKKEKNAENNTVTPVLGGLIIALNESRKRKISEDSPPAIIPAKSLVDNWLATNTTLDFITKHVALNEAIGIKQAKTIRSGSVGTSTVLILDMTTNLDSILNLNLEKNKNYQIPLKNIVQSGSIDWKRGSGTVTVTTDKNAKLYHLQSTNITNELASGRVSAGKHMKFS